MARALNRQPNVGGPTPETLTGRFMEQVAERPDAPLAVFIGANPDRTLTFEEAATQSARIAAFLRTRGYPEDAVILLFLQHSENLFTSFIGAMLAGYVPSIMPLPSPKQQPSVYWSSHRTLFERISPAAIVCDDAYVDELRDSLGATNGTDLFAAGDMFAALPTVTAELEPRSSEASIAFLQHSSGTTGLKKGVMLPHGPVLHQLESYQSALKLTENDVIVGWLPYYHDMGLITGLVMPMATGIPIITMDPFYWLARPWELLSAIQRFRGTLCWLPNFAFEHLARAIPDHLRQHDLSSMRAFINCSEPCRPATFDRFLDAYAGAGVREEMLQTCYAAAETVFAISQSDISRPVPRLCIDEDLMRATGEVSATGDDGRGLTLLSTGRPIEGLAVSVHDEAGQVLEPGHVGELAVTGQSLFTGYHRLPDATSMRLRSGQYFTGDLGFIHDEEVFVLGRRDDVIIVNGKNLYAHELEYLIADIPEIKKGRAVAFGVFDDDVGSERIVLVAELLDELALPTEQRVKRAIRERVMDGVGVYPSDVRLVEEGWLVKTTSGKISRKLNAERYSEGFGATAKGASS